ncbi:MAG: hypothetical protein ACAH21_18595 [Ramlibacter sp.]
MPKPKPTSSTDKAAKPVSRLVVILTITACLSAILGYVVFEYGLASLPEFLLVVLALCIVLPIVFLISPFWS